MLTKIMLLRSSSLRRFGSSVFNARLLSAVAPIHVEEESVVMQKVEEEVEHHPSLLVSPSPASSSFEKKKPSSQASDEELKAWLSGACGLSSELALEYSATLRFDGFDSPASIALLSVDELERRRVKTGHARLMLSRIDQLHVADEKKKKKNGGPKMFDYETIKANLAVKDALDSVEAAFGKLARGEVDVPIPMHIGINETELYGPGDCHIKGGYVSGTATWTVKLACVSFYKNLERGLPPGSGVFVVMDAATGATLGIFQENRYLTDLRTGAAGGLSVKYLARPQDRTVGFIGCGAIARNMARATFAVKPDFEGVAFAPDDSGEKFAREMSEELGVPFSHCSTPHELCRRSDIIFTQTPGSEVVLEKRWLRPHATIVASGSDQPTKQELPVDLLSSCKYVSDLTKQTSRVGELRSAIQAGAMTENDVYAELGEIINGDKQGRQGDEIVVVDLTGTGAQDAAIGQVAWDKLSLL